MKYEERANHCENPVAKKLFNVMAEKKTNLALSADVTTKKELIDLAEKLGDEICVLKTHIDIITDFDHDLTKQLNDLAKTKNFIIFEDRKFADIGNTVKHQYSKGIYRIADWADIVNAHILPGPGIIEGLKAVGLAKQRGLLLLAQMSSADNLLDNDYCETAVEWANEHPDFVIGFISTERVSDNPAHIHMTPGVKLEEGADALGQQYLTPEIIISERKSDIIIAGRGIYQAEDPLAAAKAFRERGWASYSLSLRERD